MSPCHEWETAGPQSNLANPPGGWGQYMRAPHSRETRHSHPFRTSGHQALTGTDLKPVLQRRKWLSEESRGTGRGAGCSPAGLGISSPIHPLPTPTPCTSRLLSKILSECEDADEIEYLVDGSWCPIRAEKERSCSPQCPILVLGESPAQAPNCPMVCPKPYSRGLMISEFDCVLLCAIFI